MPVISKIIVSSYKAKNRKNYEILNSVDILTKSLWIKDGHLQGWMSVSLYSGPFLESCSLLWPGYIVSVIQSFGSKINLHPHLHFLLTEGGKDQEGQFRKLSFFDESLIAKYFSREVFSMLLHD